MQMESISETSKWRDGNNEIHNSKSNKCPNFPSVSLEIMAGHPKHTEIRQFLQYLIHKEGKVLKYIGGGWYPSNLNS